MPLKRRVVYRLRMLFYCRYCTVQDKTAAKKKKKKRPGIKGGESSSEENDEDKFAVIGMVGF